MDSHKKTAASTTKSGGSATSSRRATEKPSATTSVARPEPQPTNTSTTTTTQIPTTSTATTTSPMVPLSHLELILKQLQPNFDLSKALTGLPQTQQTPTSAQPAPSDMLEPRTEEEEEVYSGATVPLGDDDDEDEKDNAISKPVGEERSVPMEEESAEGREVEQVVEEQPMVEEGAQEGDLNMEEEVEQGIRTEVVKTNLVGDMIENVVVVTDGEDEAEKEPPREMAGQGVVGHGNNLAGNIVGASVHRRRLLVDETSEEEEEDVFFQPIGGLHNQRRPAMRGTSGLYKEAV